MKYLYCVTLLLSLQAIASEPQNGQLGYGANCSKSSTHDIEHYEENGEQNCNSEQNLYCHPLTATCKCRYGSEYDEELEHCVSDIYGDCQPLGGKCPASASCIETAHHYPDHINRILLGREQRYHPNGDFRCKCDRGFHAAHGRRTCMPVLQYDEECSEELTKKNLTCDVHLGLNCSSSGTCKCNNPTTMIFNPTINRCVIKVGMPCGYTVSGQCDQNSVCPYELRDLKWIAASERSGDKGKYRYDDEFDHYFSQKLKKKETCECFPGYVKSSENKCVASYHVPCSAKSPCDKEKFLACVSGICQCERGSIEVFEGEEMTCKMQLGTPCSENKGPKCMQHAICKKGHCECGEGFSEASSISCLANHGSKCTNSYSCNNVRGLACINSKCTCFDPTFKWNNKMHMCVAGEGGFCGKFTLNQADGVEKIKMEDPFYPGVPSRTPSFYSIGCGEGTECTTEHHVWGQGLSRCKKSEHSTK